MAQPPSRSTDTQSSPVPWTPQTLTLDAWEDLGPARHSGADTVGREDGYWSTTDNEQLYWQAWFDDSPQANPRGTVALMHGYAEHSARYGHIATALVRSGYQVLAIDARGHGRSTGRRGHIDRFERYVDDMAILKRRALDRWPDQPLFMLGHSNGGLITLRYALRKPDGVTGYVVSSPLCQLALEVPRLKELLGRLTSRMVPTLSLPSGIDPGDISHIDEVVERYQRDPLVFDITTARWFTETQQAMADLAQRANTLDQPFLFLVAGADCIVDSGTTEKVFHDLGSLDRELEVFPDLSHEIFNERPWRDILQRTILWMERHRSPASP